MSNQSDHMGTAIKRARKVVGISQRDLSIASGVPQAQISKFENSRVDLRLSSLVALFRVLDLELELVPKKALPAVQAIARSTMLKSTIGSSQFARAKKAFDRILQEAAKLDSKSGELERLQKQMNLLEMARVPAAESKNFMRWTRYMERMLKTSLDSDRVERLIKRTDQLLHQIERTYSLSIQTRPQSHTYSLEEESDA